jgi:hypothetical protein
MTPRKLPTPAAIQQTCNENELPITFLVTTLANDRMATSDNDVMAVIDKGFFSSMHCRGHWQPTG